MNCGKKATKKMMSLGLAMPTRKPFTIAERFCGGATGRASGAGEEKSSYSEAIAMRAINKQPNRLIPCSMRLSTANSPVTISAAMPISSSEAPLLPSAVHSARRAPKRVAVLATITTTGPGVAISRKIAAKYAASNDRFIFISLTFRRLASDHYDAAAPALKKE